MFIAAIVFDYRSFGKFVMLAAGFFCEGKASSLIAPPEFRDKNRLPAVYSFVSSLKWIEKHTENAVNIYYVFLPLDFCLFVVSDFNYIEFSLLTKHQAESDSV